MLRTLVRFAALNVCFLISLATAAPPGNAVVVTDLSGATQTNRPFTISRIFVKGDIPNYAQARVNGAAVSTQCDVKTRWPDGSVQHALISFLATMPAGGSITVDFVNQTSGNNAGALDRTGILAANWGAQIEVTNGTTLTASARQIVTDWAGTSTDKRVTYWLQGPICTQVILEDRSPSLAYDLGWDTYKPLHPIFVVTIYPGYAAGAKVEMILENMWITKYENATYSLALKTGNPLGTTPVYSKAAFTHYASTRWRKVFWSGMAPGSANIDYNFPYMIQSKALPSYDLTKVLTANAISDEATQFNATDQGDINGNAEWLKYFPTTGGRPDIGVLPRWYARYLYSFDKTLYPVMFGNGAASASVPVHLRESNTGLKFDEAQTADAFGRPYSINAHPSGGGFVQAGTSGGDGWTVDLGHQGSFAYVPYMITGDWYFLEEVYFWGSYDLQLPVAGTCYYCRHDSWGYLSQPSQTRGKAWALRNIAHAAFAAPDGTPEKNYFTQKVNYNIAVEEGKLGITNGAFYNNPQWQWGFSTVAPQVGGAPAYGSQTNPLHFLNYDSGCNASVNGDIDYTTKAVYCDAPWMYNYVHVSWGHIEELGFPITVLRQTFIKNLLNQIRNPVYNPYLAGAYHFPVIRQPDGNWFDSWTAVAGAFSSTYMSLTSWCQVAPSSCDGDVSDGYPHLARAAASFLPGIFDGTLSGLDAWNWMTANVGFQANLNYDPKWALVPRNAQTSSPPPAQISCDLNVDGVVDLVDVQIALNQALGTSPCTNADLNNDSKCDVVDVQRVINAALGGTCRIGP